MPDMQESSTGNLGSNRPEVPKIATLNEEWYRFCAGLQLDLATMNKQEAIERKRMFFAGATVAFSLMREAGEIAEKHGDEAGEKIMESFFQQLTGYAIAVKLGEA